MYRTKDSIKFMMAKIYFTSAEFSFEVLSDITPPNYHGADSLEIKYIKSGKGKIIIDDKTYDIESEYYAVIPEFASYSIIPSTNIELYSAYLLVDKKIGFEEYIPMLSKYYIGKDYNNLGALFDDLLYEFKNKRFGYNEVIVSDFKNIIVKLLRDEKSVGKRLSHYESKSLQFEIERILYNDFSTITIMDIAQRLHLSVRELQRYLLKNYNKTFRELKADAKMSFAANKLKYTDIKIADLAILIGYSTPEHFSYAFKEFYGESPLSYKKKYKE